MGNGISSIVNNPAGAVGGVWNDATGSVRDGWNGLWQGIFGKHGGDGDGGGGAPGRSGIMRPDQMRQMGNQFSYRGAPPGMPQGMQVMPQAQRQMMMQQMQQQQMQQRMQQMQPNWDQNAYNPNQNMMMRQQQMQQPNYQNMGMFGQFNPYMSRR